MYSVKRAATLPATIAPMFLRSLTHPAVGAIATVSGVNRGVAAQRRSLRSFADISQDAYDPPSQKVAFMFPGQGAQYLGMGADLVENVGTSLFGLFSYKYFSSTSKPLLPILLIQLVV